MSAHDPRLFAGRLLVLDTETTGLSPHDGHRIVEVGLVELIDCVPSGVEYHAYVNPGRTMPAGAEAVHGLSDAFLAEHRPFRAIAPDLVDFVGEDPIIAHNAAFDLAFVDWELAACGHLPWGIARAICTVALAKRRLPGAKHSLDALCSRYGVDRSSRVKHGALLDAQLLARVYLELIGGRQITLVLGVPTPVAGDTPEVAKPMRAARPHAAEPDELVAHAAFLGTLTRPLWLTA